MLIFFLGALLGVLLGGTLCVAYLRQEITVSISPKLKRVEQQLETVESQLSLAIMTRYAELNAHSCGIISRQPPQANDY